MPSRDDVRVRDDQAIVSPDDSRACTAAPVVNLDQPTPRALNRLCHLRVQLLQQI
jgi:hypothetical protein